MTVHDFAGINLSSWKIEPINPEKKQVKLSGIPEQKILDMKILPEDFILLPVGENLIPIKVERNLLEVNSGKCYIVGTIQDLKEEIK